MINTNDSKQLREIIRILERKLGVLEDSEFSCCGITITQCHALVEIDLAKNISLKLAEILNLENSTMSRTVNNLVTSELAKRDVDPQDRRYVTISLTESGQKLFEKIEDNMGHYYYEIFSQIPEAKREQVLESLNLLLEAVVKSNCSNGKDCCK